MINNPHLITLELTIDSINSDLLKTIMTNGPRLVSIELSNHHWKEKSLPSSDFTKSLYTLKPPCLHFLHVERENFLLHLCMDIHPSTSYNIVSNIVSNWISLLINVIKIYIPYMFVAVVLQILALATSLFSGMESTNMTKLSQSAGLILATLVHMNLIIMDVLQVEVQRTRK